MKVTIKDIAQAAGVAKSTVSKVMNDSPKISEETKSRVREIIKQMNYTPSSIATGLARQSSNTIAILIDMSKESEFLNQFFYNIIGGVESVIGPLKYELTIANIQHDHAEGHFLHRLVLNKRVDGIIANTSVLTPDSCAELNRLQFPYISIGEIAAPGVWVDCDNELGGFMLTRHLLEQGYPSVAFIGGQKDEPLFLRRAAGYKRALGQAGIAVRGDWIINGRAVEEDGYQAALQLLQSAEPPGSIVCMSNFSAYGVLQAARELQLPIPSGLGIATFDEYPLSPYTTPPLTSLDMDTFQLGVSAGRLLMDKLNNKAAAVSGQLLEPELIPRLSSRRSSMTQ
ncbi:LacI family DNA-binding transcriptional regulator [Paenibacillus tritici]|uniref:LacI family DNA-binding transcriptional regulator n=1 Tax=Paenibacillus tritici TaxID=1873425 RepID=UPI001BA4C971|nr:LacI family DNA-binding transcriptional regulator [Paenibacillus tritici]QUL54101.1 LacI family DNA-binding transcriptional regulator [Paenibacillus tritici]